MKLIATFYSHFGAVRFVKKCKSVECKAKPMPVPRDLSSSCGTCVAYEWNDIWPMKETPEEVEQVVEITKDGYRQLYKAENS